MGGVLLNRLKVALQVSLGRALAAIQVIRHPVVLHLHSSYLVAPIPSANLLTTSTVLPRLTLLC
jgi:hypothetical protein